ncbi:MAG: hypothetical protein M1404_02700 [Acidobacteria bacterium]|nr:hypothetical protein [Acidobacteriota bacterium]
MATTHNGVRPTTGPGLLDRLTALQWSTHRGLFIGLFCVLGTILLAPVWTVRYPPLIDYPNHLASAFVLAHLKDPAFHFSQFYGSDWSPTPYLTMDLILVGLLHFLPVMVVGRVFLSLCLLAVPPAVWFFIRQANPGQESLAFWSLLLCSNMFFFLYGFLNLQLGFALCFVVLGLWLRYLEAPRWGLWWLLLGLVTALYFTHILAFGMAGLIMTLYLLFSRRNLGVVLRSWLLFLPGTLIYSYWKISDTQRWPMYFRTMAGKFESLVAVMLGFSMVLDFVTLLLLLGCILWACADNPELVWNRTWLAVLGCLFLVFLAFPTNYGPGNMVDRRLLPFIFVVALVTARVGKRGMLLVPVALLLFVFRTGNVEMNFLSIQPHFEGLAQSFAYIPRNSRVLPFIIHPSDRPRPEDHFWAYGVIKRGWFSPYLFHDKGVQPFRIKLQTYTFGRDAGYLVTRKQPVKWDRVRSDYDYLWAYGAGEYSPRFMKIGKVIFDSDGLQVVRLGDPGILKTSPESSQFDGKASTKGNVQR